MHAVIRTLRAIDRKHLPACLPEVFVELLEHAKKLCESDYAQLEKIFLCYYLAISKTLNIKWNKVSECERYARLFIGALMSEKFICLSDQRRYRIASTWNYSIQKSYTDGLFRLPALILNLKLNTQDIRLAVVEFEKIEITEDATYTLKVWHTKNQSGDDIHLPLTDIYLKYGKDFTESLFGLCKYYLESNRLRIIPAFKYLSEFISTANHGMNREDFLNPVKSKEFWTDFKTWYFVTAYERSMKHRVIANNWKGFCTFASEAIFDSTCFCIPSGGIIKECPTFTNLDEINTREINGITCNYKLTQAIPIEICDSEAIEIIFKDLSNDIRSINRWAIRHAQNIKNRLMQIRKLNTLPLSNVINATDVTPGTLEFEHLTIRSHMIYGHVTEQDIRISSIFPRPLNLAAAVIASPTRETLLPLVYYLISQHPQITPNFLCTLEMYNKNNEIVGLIKTDKCAYLRGFKYRRGAQNAEQKIKLSKSSLAVVNLIIEITMPARAYLKKKSDQTWKKLLISTGKGFGYPRALGNLTYDSEQLPGVIREIRSFEKGHNHNSPPKSITLTPKSIRATKAIIDFIDHKDLNAIALSLGHKYVSERLLKRYIPKPIFEFFSRRWIRIFQQALIIEAMAGSELQLEAAGLSSAEEIAIFLESHSVEFIKDIDLPPPDKPQSLLLDNNKEILININDNILELMLRITQHNCITNEHGGLIHYWKEICEAVIQRIDANDFLRPDIRLALEQARSKLTKH